MFVDLELKLTDFEKIKRLLGNLSKIKTKSQLAALCACLEEQYLAAAPWRAEDCGFDGPMANISDQKAKFEMAKYVFKSDAYILLPRYLRFALTRYIAAVMIETKRPYEQLKDYDKLVDRSEDALPNLELPPADMDCEHYLQLMKQLLIQDDDADVDVRRQQIHQMKSAAELRDQLEQLDRQKASYVTVDDTGYRGVVHDKEQAKKAAREREILKDEEDLKDLQLCLDYMEELQQASLCKSLQEAEADFNRKRLDYLVLKLKYYLVFRDLHKCRKLAYKLDLHIRESFGNDFRLRTEFLLLHCRSLCQHKEVLPSHYQLQNWLEKLEDSEAELEAELRRIAQ